MADTVGTSILGFFNTPAGAEALTSVSAQATTTAKISVYGLMGVVTAWAVKRVVSDVIDTLTKVKEYEKLTGSTILFSVLK